MRHLLFDPNQDFQMSCLLVFKSPNIRGMIHFDLCRIDAKQESIKINVLQKSIDFLSLKIYYGPSI